VIVINVVAAVAFTDKRLAFLFPHNFLIIGAVSLLFFTVEYILRLWACVENPYYRGLSPLRARMRYIISPSALIDLVAIAPFFVVPFIGADMRSLTVLRLLRFLKIARYSPGMASVFEAVRNERHGLMMCLLLLCGGVLISASAMYAAETNAQPDKFGSVIQSMWWAVATITTVGYGDVFPVTPTGKIIAALTMICGIFTLALPVGIFATSFIEVIRRRAFTVTWGMVARLPVFASLDAAALAEVVPRLRARSVNAGETIVPRGDMPRAIFFIVSGAVEIESDGGHVKLKPGEYFGEIRSDRLKRPDVRVHALEPAQLLVLADDDIDDVVAVNEEIGERLSSVSTYAVA
jgi:voltage-gated potassium channel